MAADSQKSSKVIMSGMRQLEIRTRRMVNDSLAGAYHSVFKGRGMDFDEVREYSPGDEVRTIDWNVTARAGRTSKTSSRASNACCRRCCVPAGRAAARSC